MSTTELSQSYDDLDSALLSAVIDDDDIKSLALLDLNDNKTPLVVIDEESVSTNKQYKLVNLMDINNAKSKKKRGQDVEIPDPVYEEISSSVRVVVDNNNKKKRLDRNSVLKERRSRQSSTINGFDFRVKTRLDKIDRSVKKLTQKLGSTKQKNDIVFHNLSSDVYDHNLMVEVSGDSESKSSEFVTLRDVARQSGVKLSDFVGVNKVLRNKRSSLLSTRSKTIKNERSLLRDVKSFEQVDVPLEKKS